jgi:hypothetical protein
MKSLCTPWSYLYAGLGGGGRTGLVTPVLILCAGRFAIGKCPPPPCERLYVLEKRICFHFRESNHDSAVVPSLVTTHTELSQLLMQFCAAYFPRSSFKKYIYVYIFFYLSLSVLGVTSSQTCLCTFGLLVTCSLAILVQRVTSWSAESLQLSDCIQDARDLHIPTVKVRTNLQTFFAILVSECTCTQKCVQ